ncbi:hypothetical protein DTL42_15540 [Bremerella cremea]|uniref:Porin n=1 Tax=Bremerella cremea TaxID=1031537 RepID=A0A368KRH6_9BACT|nr:porin [Bremerella cremea]RCS46379.1 hypothetical protein DTL42_15540 [Bremerella cremea]
MTRWIVIGAVFLAGSFSTAYADFEFPGIGEPPLPMQVTPVPGITAQQAADLQAQIDELKRELAREKLRPMSAPVSTPAEIAPDLSQDVDSLLKWKATVEKEDAKAAAKAALKPSVNVGGRFFLDSAVFSQNQQSVDQVGDAENAIKLRTCWVELKGNVLENTQYRLWFDLSSQVSLLDVYLDFGELPYIQNFRIGHFFEPFSMQQLTPNKYLTFMERSSPFLLGRDLGVMAHSDNADANWTYGIGLFVSEQSNKPPFYQSDEDSSAITGRFTYLPWYDEASDGRGLIHFGVGYSWRHLGDKKLRFRNRPDSALAPFIVDTGNFAATAYNLAGLEAAYAYGSFIMQSEYHYVSADTVDFGAESFDHYYIQASYVLTGENRPYNRRSGSFSNRIVPYENFFRVRTADGCIGRGRGAWEIAYRYAHDNLTSDNIFGGRDYRHLVSLNWYLSPFTRAMFEYDFSQTNDPVASHGDLHVFQMRMQFDF